MSHFDRAEQDSTAHPRRGRPEDPCPPGLPSAGQDKWAIELIDVVDVRRAGGGEVTFVCEIRPLLVLHSADQLRYQEADVGVAVRMRAGWRVHRHARDSRRE